MFNIFKRKQEETKSEIYLDEIKNDVKRAQAKFATFLNESDKYFKKEIANTKKPLFYLLSFSSEELLLVKADPHEKKVYDKTTIESLINTYHSIESHNLTIDSIEIPWFISNLRKINSLIFYKHCASFEYVDNNLKDIKKTLANHQDLFVTIANGDELFIKFEKFDDMSFKTIYSFDELVEMIAESRNGEYYIKFIGWYEDLFKEYGAGVEGETGM